MNRRALWLTAASALVAFVATSAIAQERVVNVYNWSDYIDSTIIEDFTKETGIKVVYDCPSSEFLRQMAA